MSRNELCACGSGKRFKHCHGRMESAMPSALHFEALAAHKSGSLRRAEELYRRALEVNADDVESLHMLGVVRFERRRYREALDLLWDAAERTGWNDAILRQNLGLVLAKLLSPQANARQEALVASYSIRKRALEAAPIIAARVSVVLPVYNQASSVAHAIASVAAQTHADIELVVVDDGSTDGTAVAVTECLAGFARTARLLRCEHRGAAQAANHGAASATGRYLAFLHADDWFARDRVEQMVGQIARATPLWGFSQVTFAGDLASSADASDHKAGGPVQPRDFLSHDPVSFTLLARDVIGPSGNLFVDRDLFQKVGGFRDIPRHRGWDFCVRAAEAVEPVPVARHLYFHGGQDRDRIRVAAAPGATDRRTAELVAGALNGDAAATNEFCPQFPGNREMLLRSELRAGHGDRIPVPVLRALAADWRARPPAPTPHRHDRAASERGDKVALVVLGVYRSGTSAVARALNLCGASLPEGISAARLGINPKGFWEAEAVAEIDARLMEHLGADWHRADFELPKAGPLVEEFLLNTREMLATEYGDAPLILIKDPRISVLAPLWDRTLKQSGYRPGYVVVVRHPLEVAGSLETQGDMAVADGLSLWLTYMRRVESFADASGADVVHVRYAELLDDWRGVLQRIARRLDVTLELEERADEVDRFLEAGMRTHQAADADLDAHLAGANGEAIGALYRRLLQRCERDAIGSTQR
jgi:hypothetical protein